MPRLYPGRWVQPRQASLRAATPARRQEIKTDNVTLSAAGVAFYSM